MTKRWNLKLRKILDALAAVVDQAWLSLLSFATSLVLIRAASKDEFALYILLLTPILLLQGAQQALLLSPQATILPASPPEKQAKVRATCCALQVGFGFVAGGVGAASVLAYESVVHEDINFMLPLAFALALFGTLGREGVRALQYATRMPRRALVGDLVYGVVLIAYLTALVVMESVSAENVLLAIGVAALIPFVPVLRRTRVSMIDSGVTREFWALGRWALPGVLVTWLNLNSYSYVVAARLGASAVADINAARLPMMPLAVSINSWSNMARPRISELNARGDYAAISRISLRAVGVGLLLVACYLVLVLTFYGIVEWALGASYLGLFPLVLGWGLYFAIAQGRAVLMATLMASAEGYRDLYYFSWIGLALALPGLVLFSPLGALWVVGVLCVVEFVLMVLVSRSAWRKWQGRGA